MTAVGVMLLACSSADGWSYDGPRSACSTGAPHGLSSSIPELPNSAGNVQAAECIARCGVSREEHGHYGSTWTVAALPSGACSYDGEVCSMSAVRTLECPDGRTVACSLTGYACRCESGSWNCYAGAPGASSCVCSLPEAGTPEPDGASGASE